MRHLFLKIPCLLLSLLLCYVPLHAYDFYQNGIYYNVTSEENLEVEVTCPPEGQSCYAGHVVIPATITESDWTYSVTSIGEHAFSYQLDMTELTLGANIRSIGEYGIIGCSLVGIYVDELNTDFCSMDGVLYNHDMSILVKYPECKISNPIYIPSSVTKIENHAMSCLKGVPDIKMTGSVTELGKGCFSGAEYGINVDLSVNVTEIPQDAFYGCGDSGTLGSVSINLEHIKSIGDNAFAQTSVRQVHCPNVVRIGQKAFEKCKIGSVILCDKCNLVPLNAFWEAEIQKGAYPDNINSMFPADSRNPFTYSKKPGNFTGFGEDAIIVYPAGAVIENGAIISADGTTLYYAPPLRNDNYITPEGVTTIGDFALSYLNADHLTFRSSVVEISPKALAYNQTFYYNFGPDLPIGYSNSSFKIIDGILFDNTETTVISCPENLHGMINGRYDYIKELTLPASVENVADYAFYSTTLNKLNFQSSLKNIGDYAFSSQHYGFQISIPSVSQKIGNFSFSCNYRLKTLEIEPSVTSIGIGAFCNCEKFEKIELPNLITEIPDNLFRECFSLDNVVIPDGVTKVGNSAFYNCEALTSVPMPNSVSEIGNSAFYRCGSLTEINLAGVTKIHDRAFDCCWSLADVVLPATVTEIGELAFSGTKIKSLDLNSIVTLGNSAFSWCSKIENIKIGNSIAKIGEGTFNGCSNLKKLELGNRITEIDKRAFKNCEALTNIISFNPTPPILREWPSNSYECVFPSSIAKTCNVYVPSESLDKYKSDVLWSRYFDNIYPLSDYSDIINITEEDIKIANVTDGVSIVNARGKNVSIYDMMGHIVFNEESYSGEVIQLPKGLYIVRVGSVAHKIII